MADKFPMPHFFRRLCVVCCILLDPCLFYSSFRYVCVWFGFILMLISLEDELSYAILQCVFSILFKYFLCVLFLWRWWWRCWWCWWWWWLFLFRCKKQTKTKVRIVFNKPYKTKSTPRQEKIKIKWLDWYDVKQKCICNIYVIESYSMKEFSFENRSEKFVFVSVLLCEFEDCLFDKITHYSIVKFVNDFQMIETLADALSRCRYQQFNIHVCTQLFWN